MEMIKLQDILKEAKQVGIIYHYTTFESGLKVLELNQLKSDHTAESTNAKPVFGISFTRDKRFNNANRAVDFTNSSFGILAGSTTMLVSPIGTSKIMKIAESLLVRLVKDGRIESYNLY